MTETTERVYYDRKDASRKPVQLPGVPRRVFRELREQGWQDPQVRQFLPEGYPDEE